MKLKPFRIFIFLIASLLLLPQLAEATHLRAGEITVRRDACNSLKFYITVTVFTNTINTNVLFGGPDDILDFGDGSDPNNDGIIGVLVPETPNTPRPDLGEGIATASYTIEHIYAAGDAYVISYSEPNRNDGVLNMDGSVNTRFYIETEIIVDPFLGCNENTPILAVPPIDRGCTGVAWFHNPGAYDLDGDSLSYEMVIPFRDRATTVVNYRSPAAPEFYAGFYDTGNEAGLGKPTFSINQIDGTITWDAPGKAGEYNIAFVIREWRKVDGEWTNIGFVRRDMQIIIEDCENKRPDLIVPEDVCIQAGQPLDKTIFATDPDNDNVKIEAFSEIFFLAEAQSPATYGPNPPAFQPSTPSAQLKFHWNTECAHVKEQPYQVVFKVTDKGRPSLATFKTWRIRVVGPKPQFPDDDTKAIKTDLVNRYVTLTWDKYFCENAQVMQVWRRVDSLAFEPDTCQTGMPENLGYKLITVLPINGDTTYTDTNGGKGLNAASVYCYRLVAIFPSPRGGESPVSKEVCVPAIKADEAIITKVSVVTTDAAEGEIKVSWVPPFESEIPGPYTYDVYRSDGFSGKGSKVTTLSDTTFVDTGLNTTSKVYNYSILAKSGEIPLDTSSTASSVRLEAQSELNNIDLHWTADVPWSNEIPGYKHRIYRGDEGATTIDQLQLIDEVEVLGNGMVYSDAGQYNGVPLEAGKIYCYAIETFGSYGNDNPILKDRDPLKNFSQIVCTQLGDTVKPCKPTTPLAANVVDCEQYVNDETTCNANQFQNVIKWNRVTDECGTDIAYYIVYFARGTDVDFDTLAKVIDTVYVHDRGLTSFAGCYRISAVDRSGNESALSDPVCFDNCPYYELPNVFTPNQDPCNNLFSAYNNRGNSGGESGPACAIIPADSRKRCARFVEDVTFTVYNRWGREVYSYSTLGSTGDKTIYIDWDGRNNDGVELASGIYYYVADVVFITSNPDKRNKTYKGWVHLLR